MLYLYVLIAVQIVIESLPISSSGHVMLFERMMSTCGTWVTSIVQSTMPCGALPDQLLENSMRVAHGATLIILGLFFAQPLFAIMTHRRLMYHAITRTIPYVFVADCVTALWYLLIHEKQLIHIPLYAGFTITMLILYGTRRMYAYTRTGNPGIISAVVLGCAQGIALLPGISRLAFVYAAAYAVGFKPMRAFQMAWAIHAPLMAAVTVLGMYRMYAMRSCMFLLPTTADVMVIMSACVLGYGALYAVWSAVQRGTIWKYAWYMPAPILVSLFVAH